MVPLIDLFLMFNSLCFACVFQIAGLPQHLWHPNSDPTAGGAHSDLAPERAGEGMTVQSIKLTNKQIFQTDRFQ